MKIGKIVLHTFYLLLITSCGNREITFNQINELYSEKKYENIITLYEQNQTVFQNDPDLINKLGMSYYSLGKVLEADYYLKEAISLNDKESMYYSNKALTEISLRKYLDALSNCQIAMDLDKENFNAYVNRGYAFIKLKDWDSALNDLNKSLSIKDIPRNELAIAFANLGTVYLNKRENQKALEYSLEAMKINDKIPWTYKNLASLKMQEQKIKEAMEYIDVGLSLKPKDEILLYYKGLIFAKTGNRLEGCGLMKMAFKKINKIDPNLEVNENYKLATKSIDKYCN